MKSPHALGSPPERIATVRSNGNPAAFRIAHWRGTPVLSYNRRLAYRGTDSSFSRLSRLRRIADARQCPGTFRVPK
jgi:hypothetical protein